MFRRARLIAVALLVASIAAGEQPAASSPRARKPLVVIGNPIDRRDLTDVPFGRRSHWLQPWRAYLDTVPATRLLDAVGIDFDVPPAQSQTTARMLSRAGFRRARVEIGWGSFSYAHPDRPTEPAALHTTLRALAAAHLRPLILLNANDLEPCPMRTFDATLVDGAARGATSVHVDAPTAAAIVPR